MRIFWMTLLMVAFLAGMWLLVRGEQAEAPSNVDEAFLGEDSAESKSVQTRSLLSRCMTVFQYQAM
jgi:hypothetical protein